MVAANLILLRTQRLIYRGGVTLAFPQFGDGRLARDGFLQDMEWELVGSVRYQAAKECVLTAYPLVCLRPLRSMIAREGARRD